MLIQNNNNFGMNPGYRTQDVLNIQPVIPLAISKDWNLLVRWIMPIVYQPLPNQPGNPETGVYGLSENGVYAGLWDMVGTLSIATVDVREQGL